MRNNLNSNDLRNKFYFFILIDYPTPLTFMCRQCQIRNSLLLTTNSTFRLDGKPAVTLAQLKLIDTFSKFYE